MAMNMPIICPVEDCAYSTNLRFDPGPESHHVLLAKEELKAEHPVHDSRSWKFLKREAS